MKKTAATVALLLASLGAPLRAQGGSVLLGMVLADRIDVPLRDAEILITGLGLQARSDARGNFSLGGIMAGNFQVTVRRVGFAPQVVSLPFNGSDTVRYQFSLLPVVQTLPGVAVTGREDVPRLAKLAVFESRRKFGQGRFLTQDYFANLVNRRTGDALSARLPGARIMRDTARPSAAYVASARGINSIEGSAPAFSSGRTAPGKACLVQVWLDGARVFSGLPGEPPYDINTLQPTEIIAVEFYSGSASLPAELANSNSACGAIVIWTK